MTRALLLVAALTWATSACNRQEVAQVRPVGDGGGGDLALPIDPLTLSPRCSSGITRDPNESEGPEMNPGRACNQCHADTIAATGEDAPIFAFAGTVYPSGHEPDNCSGAGAAGAQVVVTDATGAVFTALVNGAGNFLLEPDKFVTPLRAKVVWQGRERAMRDEQDSGDCNGCHTAAGAEGAPGRIVLP